MDSCQDPFQQLGCPWVEDWGHRYGGVPGSLWQNAQLGVRWDRHFQVPVGPHPVWQKAAGKVTLPISRGHVCGEALDCAGPAASVHFWDTACPTRSVPGAGGWVGGGDRMPRGQNRQVPPSRELTIPDPSRGLDRECAGCWNKDGIGQLLTHMSF